MWSPRRFGRLLKRCSLRLRLLMFAQAVSPRLEDLFVKALQTRVFGWVFGTFRGRMYQHG